MTNLSEQLQAKTEAFKANVESAKTANKAELEQKLADAKSKAEMQKMEWSAQIDTRKSKIQEEVDGIKSKIASKKADFKKKAEVKQAKQIVKVAEWTAEDAEENAKELMTLAFHYIDKAQIAVMEAIIARMKTEAIKAEAAKVIK